MHPDYERYVKACDYPGVLDEKAVERHLAEYLRALGIERQIVQLKSGWSLDDHPPLQLYVRAVLAEFLKRDARVALDALGAQAARDARVAQAARDARDARAIHRFACLCIQAYSWQYWRFELSWLVTTWFGAKTEAVKIWSQPLFNAFICGTWMLHWTDDTLYWVAKPRVHTERPSRGFRRLHCETGPAVESDVEDLYFWHGVMVPSKVVETPERITVEEIEAEKNMEVQRIMIERLGADKYMRQTGAKVLDMDSLTLVGSAPRALMEDKRGNKWMIGTDGSTKRVYLMAVPRDVRTCSEAHRAISGLDKESRLIAEA